MIPPSLNADLFCNKTRCIQGQPSDVGGVIVLHKSGILIPIFAHNGETDGEKEDAKEWGWIKMVDWHYAFEIILINHR